MEICEPRPKSRSTTNLKIAGDVTSFVAGERKAQRPSLSMADHVVVEGLLSQLLTPDNEAIQKVCNSITIQKFYTGSWKALISLEGDPVHLKAVIKSSIN